MTFFFIGFAASLPSPVRLVRQSAAAAARPGTAPLGLLPSLLVHLEGKARANDCPACQGSYCEIIRDPRAVMMVVVVVLRMHTCIGNIVSDSSRCHVTPLTWLAMIPCMTSCFVCIATRCHSSSMFPVIAYIVRISSFAVMPNSCGSFSSFTTRIFVSCHCSLSATFAFGRATLVKLPTRYPLLRGVFQSEAEVRDCTLDL